MRHLKGILNFYINSSIHVALAVCALVGITVLKYKIELDDFLYFFVFFSTISGYNFVKYFGLAKFHHRSLANWLKQIQIFSFLCFLPLIYFTLKLDRQTMILLGVLGLITFFYAIPFFPRRLLIDRSRNLRAISGLKIYVIALVWGVVTVILPAISSQTELSNDLILEFIQRCLFVIVAMLPFEIRDLQYDSLKLATIPQQIGVNATKVLGTVLILIFFALNWFRVNLHFDHLLTDMIISLIMILFVWMSKTTQSAYYTSFWVEAVPIVWLGLVVLF